MAPPFKKKDMTFGEKNSTKFILQKQVIFMISNKNLTNLCQCFNFYQQFHQLCVFYQNEIFKILYL